jgi:hypothetical protein
VVWADHAATSCEEELTEKKTIDGMTVFFLLERLQGAGRGEIDVDFTRVLGSKLTFQTHHIHDLQILSTPIIALI